VRRTSRALVRRLALGIVSFLFLLAVQAAASAHTCNDTWCSGNDGSSRYNTQGNDPRTYVGEVGIYYHDFDNNTEDTPCNWWPNGACFNAAAANAAKSLWSNNNGIGTQFYYFGGGAGADLAAQYDTPYCWGWAQGRKAVNIASSRFDSYYGSAWVFFLDIEQGGQYGWFSTMSADNRDVYDGFRDYVQQADSQQPAHCSNPNTTQNYQVGIYSSAYWWNYAMGSHNDLQTASQWTNDDCCDSTWPGDFHLSNSDEAHWFGGSGNAANHFMWQFDDGSHPDDFDIATEPFCLPHFNNAYCLGT
jgi:hypothetical protein